MDETRENLRKQAANQFEETMRDMLQDAQKLEQRNKSSIKKLYPTRSNAATEGDSEQRSGLRPEGDSPSDRQADRQAWEVQKQELKRLSEAMQATVQEAESSEPLLADKLYDDFEKRDNAALKRSLTKPRSWPNAGSSTQLVRSPKKPSKESASCGKTSSKPQRVCLEAKRVFASRGCGNGSTQ